MATFGLELLKSQRVKSGRHPIYIRVFHKDVPKRKQVGEAYVHEWDQDKKKIKPKGRPNHIADNIHIENEYDKYKAIFNKLKNSNVDWNPEDVFKEQKPEVKVETNFKYLAKNYLESLDQYGDYHELVSTVVNKLERFTITDFDISEINKIWIDRFKNHCQTKEKDTHGEVGNSEGTIRQAFRIIKRIIKFNDLSNSDLFALKIKEPETFKDRLSEDELIKFAALELTGIDDHARNIYLVQFYFRGMRIGDALRLRVENIKGERLQYKASKTGIMFDMKIVKPCMDILKKYIDGRGSGYVFPLMKRDPDLCDEKVYRREVKNNITKINNSLKVTSLQVSKNKKITSHTAKHSFSDVADEKTGGDLRKVQGLLGHKNRAMTERYISQLRKSRDLDNLADDILL